MGMRKIYIFLSIKIECSPFLSSKMSCLIYNSRLVKDIIQEEVLYRLHPPFGSEC